VLTHSARTNILHSTFFLGYIKLWVVAFIKVSYLAIWFILNESCVSRFIRYIKVSMWHKYSFLTTCFWNILLLEVLQNVFIWQFAFKIYKTCLISQFAFSTSQPTPTGCTKLTIPPARFVKLAPFSLLQPLHDRQPRVSGQEHQHLYQPQCWCSNIKQPHP